MATPAQEEFNRLIASSTPRETTHPEDRAGNKNNNNNDDDDDEHAPEELTEEEMFRNAQIEATMRMPVGPSAFHLPPRSFDSGHATGVKGVIADARHYQSARRSQFGRRAHAATPRALRNGNGGLHSGSEAESDNDNDYNDDFGTGSGSGSGSDDDDDDEEEGEEEFLQQWRETRRRELESDASRAVRTRRTSPSVRVYGRMDEVDALGYLDAIEKVGRETTVVVFVYDHECEVSGTIDAAIQPLVKKHPAAHFVKIHYEEIEFDNAAVPAILAYRNQGDLVANLTGLIEMMPDDDDNFGADDLEHILRTHAVL
ncbi:Phosducin-like protein [Escovopsis weberi]|uniref:Phosducin-like protein n=1 Tax=Escovopsis weberi TaxID=150374 RepID=A0A0M8MYB1_ESCWE|nr:Phosducin-like protein [Escovopsis weberi]